ncbi:uncharacterized protein [Miscanthus floridulus]|uniref:uncharacterized protein n=1 Tax=Miscanthus floridulus TaxID=154761 RepID=UPI00345A827F
MTLPSTNTEWYADSGAGSHMTAHSGILSSPWPPSLSGPSSVVVGNGALLPITSVGSYSFSMPRRSLTLNNVLVAPNIIKKLISVRRFTTDNNCSIEFNPFGLSVKDLQTRCVIARCNSTGDLYPFFPPSSVPALATAVPSITLWHRRLGHLGTVSKLISSQAISCTKPKNDHFGSPFKAVQCDNGRGFDNSPARTFFLTQGAVLHMSCPYTSQQNGSSTAVHMLGVPTPAPVPGAHRPAPTSPASAPMQRMPTIELGSCPGSAITPDDDSSGAPTVFGSAAPADTLSRVAASRTRHTFSTRPVVIEPVHNAHPMRMRGKAGIAQPVNRLNLHVVPMSPLPRSVRDAPSDSNWHSAMQAEFDAFIANDTWCLVPQPLGVNLWQYTLDILERAEMSACKPCSTPVDLHSKLFADGPPVADSTQYLNLAGALQYLTFTRPDIGYAV